MFDNLIWSTFDTSVWRTQQRRRDFLSSYDAFFFCLTSAVLRKRYDSVRVSMTSLGMLPLSFRKIVLSIRFISTVRR